MTQGDLNFMVYFDLVKTAKNALLANKLRSFLTMLGIIIGITAVIVIMSVGAGAQSLIVNQVKKVGSNLIGVLPGGSDDKTPPASVMGITITTLKYEDAKALEDKSRVPHLVAATAHVRSTQTVTWESNKVDVAVDGTTANYPLVEGADLEEGRWFDEQEEKNIGRVAILGYQVWEDLFAGENAIGQNVKIKKENFKVIGIVKKTGSKGMINVDNQIYIPITAGQKLISGINYISMIRAKVDSEENLNQTVEDVRVLLRERHNIDNPEEEDFTVRNQLEALSILTNITNAIKYFLVAIGAIALLVGGVGIMNIMLVAVNERRREIGLRKSVGATKANLMSQFLFESIFLTFIGGIIGIIAGSCISTIIALIAKYLGYDWDLVISIWSILLACGVCVAVGLIFGLYPARRAARLNPIEALRYE